MWHSPDGVGLPIGDLTSQLFSNIYLNGLDRFVTETLGVYRYGGYVDDFYLLDTSCESLQANLQPIRQYLQNIGMTLHPDKIVLQPVSLPGKQKNVPALEFLGALVYPYYRHCTCRTIAKYRRYCRAWAIALADMADDKCFSAVRFWRMEQSFQSYRGYFTHFKGTNL